jgi:hypothetical protein
MLNRLLEDLRFVIGAFFAILSCILAATGALHPPTDPTATNLNLAVGGIMGIFAIFMITLSIRDLKK